MTRTLDTKGLLVLALLWGCGRGGDTPHSPPTVAAAQAPVGPHRIVAYATQSLKRPFTALAEKYEADHPGAKVELHFAGGAELLATLQGGAPADLVAVADSSLMSRIAGSAILAPGKAAELARSHIAIAVAKGNPLHIAGIRDLARQDVRVAMGTRSSSIGRYARWVLSREPLEVTPKVEVGTAAEVLTEVGAGRADAGIVYVTTFADLPGTAEAVEMAATDNAPVLYSISMTREAKEPRGAEAFLALALGPTGQTMLHDAGFLPIGAKVLDDKVKPR